MCTHLHSVRNIDSPGVQRSCDISSLAGCDINVMWFEPGFYVPWVRHRVQTDEFFVAAGSLLVGLLLDEPSHAEWVTLSATTRSTLRIPAGMWHCFRASQPAGCVLVYVISPRYNLASPDAEFASDAAIALPLMAG
jgi:dTDP-4-dehydrorhamnose 3,5-epimerase-like enzyme